MKGKRCLLAVMGVIVLFLVGFSGVAMAEQTDEYVYEVREEGIVLTDYIATPFDAAKVEIPKEIDGHPVIGLEGTFKENQRVVSVILPEGVLFLGDDTFYDCETLVEIGFPSTLERIGKKCFYNTGLEEVILPASVKQVDVDAFSRCKKLVRADLSNYMQSRFNGSFSYCSGLKEVILPDTLEIINEGSFMYCESLEKIVWPSKLKRINDEAFFGCSSLREIVLPDTVEKIGAAAFGGDIYTACVSLEKVEFPDSLKVIYADAFINCKSLKEVRLPEKLECLWSGAFMGCDSLEEFVIPEGIIPDNIGTGVAGGKKLKQIINNSPYDLDERVFRKYDKTKEYAWFADENCTEVAKFIPAKSSIYRGKAELYGNVAKDILEEASIFVDGVSMKNMNSKEEIEVYLSSLLPFSADVSVIVKVGNFSAASAGTRWLPSGLSGSASNISLVVRSNHSQIDMSTVEISKRLEIYQESYNASEDKPSGGSSFGSGGSSGSGSSSGGRLSGNGAAAPGNAGLTVTKPSVSAGHHMEVDSA